MAHNGNNISLIQSFASNPNKDIQYVLPKTIVQKDITFAQTQLSTNETVGFLNVMLKHM
jgi:hypothetical protein